MVKFLSGHSIVFGNDTYKNIKHKKNTYLSIIFKLNIFVIILHLYITSREYKGTGAITSYVQVHYFLGNKKDFLYVY